MVQKAFDTVSDTMKVHMLQELLRDIRTIYDQHACHVWQKVIELPHEQYSFDFMQQLNTSLHQEWHKVAVSETGSLIVQNIFENCVENEKVSVGLSF